MESLFEMQDNVTRAIIGAIEPALLGAEEMHALQSPRRDARFWDLFLRGRRLFWRSNAKDVHEAERVLEEALALRPDDASALAILAHCKLYDVWVGTSLDPGSAIADAYRIALGAVFAAPTDAFAHYTLGVVLSVMNRGSEAEAEQRRALELNPYLAAALGEVGRVLAFAGRSDEAIAYSDRAIAASPNDPHAWLWFRSKAIARFVAADYERAARDAADACARGPRRFYLHLLLAACYSAGGRLGEAHAALKVGRRLAREAAAGAPQIPESTAHSLEPLRLGHPFVDPAHFDRFVAALDQAANHK
jgi:tetratricopeptide (TPR) repeat protein